MLPLVAQELPKWIRWRISPPTQITANSSRSELFRGDTKMIHGKEQRRRCFLYFPRATGRR